MSGFQNSSGFHHSFDRARSASVLKTPGHAIIGLHLLHSLAFASPRAWTVMEQDPKISIDATLKLYEDCFRRIFLEPESFNAEDAKECLEEIGEVFARCWPMLARNAERIPEPVLHTAHTGMLFTESVLSKKSSEPGAPIYLYGANPFLALHVAADVLNDIDKNLRGDYREHYWSQGTRLYKDMSPYCYELRNLHPVDLVPGEASEEEFRSAMQALSDLNAMMKKTIVVADRLFVDDSIKGINALHDYLAPFTAPPHEPVASLPFESSVTSMDGFRDLQKQKRERRDAQVAAWEQGRAP